MNILESVKFYLKIASCRENIARKPQGGGYFLAALLLSGVLRNEIISDRD